MKLNINIILMGMILLLSSCTDHALNETTYDTLEEDEFFQTERQVMSAVGPVYNQLTGDFHAHWAMWGVNELTTDVGIIPTRGRHWWDGGEHLRMHRHNWNLTEGPVNSAWNYVFDGVSNANRIRYQIEQLDEPSEVALGMLPELDALRAWFYFWGLDLFGNIPIVTDHDVEPGFAPTNETREDVFYFVVDELENAIPQLNSEVSNLTYGRFHRWAAHTMLAKVYLNSRVYTGDPNQVNDGTAYWDKVIEHTSAVIESGHFSLEGDYFTNFSADNDVSSENIFVGPIDPVYSGWGQYALGYATLHYSMDRAFAGFQGGPWNGPAITPEFVNLFDEDDLRRGMFFSGIQFDTAGDTLYASERLAGEPLDLVNYIGDAEDALENEGYRLGKYDYTGYREGNTEGDIAFFRYADVLLMKAEALMRQNGDQPNQEALDLVNRVRDRAGLDNLTLNELTMEELLDERGREFALDQFRRNDMIRFGKFIEPFYEGSETDNMEKENVNDPTRRLFHIPQQQINANPNLDQNPGY